MRLPDELAAVPQPTDAQVIPHPLGKPLNVAAEFGQPISKHAACVLVHLFLSFLPPMWRVDGDSMGQPVLSCQGLRVPFVLKCFPWPQNCGMNGSQRTKARAL